MAQKDLRVESLDSGSNYQFGDKLDVAKNPRSGFDLTHLVTTTIPNGGYVYPIDIIECLPGDSHDLTIDSLVRVMPQVVPLFSRQRMYVYAFYSRMCDLWSNFETFKKKGYTGNVIKRVPTLNDNNMYDSANSHNIKPNSLADCLGLPQHAFTSHFKDVISALPFMMYLRIYRDYFMNKNFHINDRVLLPDDDTRFRLDDDGKLLSAKDEGVDVQFDIFNNDFTYNSINYFKLDGSTPSWSPTYTPEYEGTKYNKLHVSVFAHEWPLDYFTSALPWTQRGDTPYLDLTLDTSDLNIKTNFEPDSGTAIAVTFGANPNGASTVSDVKLTTGGSPYINSINEKFASHFYIEGSSVASNITLNDIRELAVNQTIAQKLSNTDGSYKEYGLTFFGKSCANSVVYKPVYIGGVSQEIHFTEVLQTSSSVESDDSQQPLGQIAGHGIAMNSNNYLGHVECDDFGYIMILACVMPDVYYHEGIEKHWCDLMESDFFLPERAKLGLKAILNKELYFSGIPEEDNKLFAYQDQFDELRFQPNKIHGKIAAANNKSFYPYTQARKFDGLPNYGVQFATAFNVRKDYLAAKDEDAYAVQFCIGCRSVRELPYQSRPASII